MGLFGLIKWGIIIALASVGVQLWLASKDYSFDEKTVMEIGKKYAGTAPKDMIRNIGVDLRAKYPQRILPDNIIETFLVRSGGITMSITIFHYSWSEVIAVFGTQLPANGYSGRHWGTANSLILSGSIKKWKENTMTPKEYKKGDVIFTDKFEASGISTEEGTWVLEYFRGFAPGSSLNFLGNSLFSHCDLFTVYKLLKFSFKASMYNVSHLLSFLSSKIVP